MELFVIGDNVKSLRDQLICGVVIGCGVLTWPDADTDMVYLVQIRPKGSSSFGPAVAVLRCDQVEKI